MLGGYAGKILEVNLTTGQVADKDLPPEPVMRKFLGGFGLGLWMLYDRCPPGVAALDPESPMIFLNGPLVGSHAPALRGSGTGPWLALR